MSLDTKYRPRRFEDVLGQKATIRICRQLVKSGRGFRQSYLFAGQWGSGKTTTARIFARALLCESPDDGNPCDQCTSCRSILDNESSLSLTEVDAATNSSKDNVRRILEEIDFAHFGGHRRIFIFDEAHQLSKDAVDALLKPLEEDAPGSEDKRLVVMFATTEPEKMKDTILSRCAPAFVIEPVSPKDIAERMAHICEVEGIPYDLEALKLVAEVKECHIRDVLKTIDGLSLMGGVTPENVTSYLRLDASTGYLDVLENLGKDLTTVVETVNTLLATQSPTTVYERLAHLALMAFHVHLKVDRAPLYLDADRVAGLYAQHGASLLTIASTLAERPGRPSGHMLTCDLAKLHYGGLPQMLNFATPSFGSPAQLQGNQRTLDSSDPRKNAGSGGKITQAPRQYDDNGVYVDERLVRKSGMGVKVLPAQAAKTTNDAQDQLAVNDFAALLAKGLSGD